MKTHLRTCPAGPVQSLRVKEMLQGQFRVELRQAMTFLGTGNPTHRVGLQQRTTHQPGAATAQCRKPEVDSTGRQSSIHRECDEPSYCAECHRIYLLSGCQFPSLRIGISEKGLQSLTVDRASPGRIPPLHGDILQKLLQHSAYLIPAFSANALKRRSPSSRVARGQAIFHRI